MSGDFLDALISDDTAPTVLRPLLVVPASCTSAELTVFAAEYRKSGPAVLAFYTEDWTLEPLSDIDRAIRAQRGVTAAAWRRKHDRTEYAINQIDQAVAKVSEAERRVEQARADLVHAQIRQRESRR